VVANEVTSELCGPTRFSVHAPIAKPVAKKDVR
jgi:hypothetical protein